MKNIDESESVGLTTIVGMQEREGEGRREKRNKKLQSW